MNAAGDRVAIGARLNDGSDANSGHVRVYQLIGNTWTQLGADLDGEAADDESGWSVSMNATGDRVAIGAIFNDGNGLNSGHTRIYQWNSSTDAWTKMGADIDGEAADDQSGYSVSMNAAGDRVAIGATRNSGNGTESGHVRIYQWNSSTDAWTQLGLDINGEATFNWSGFSVSMNAAGDRVAIGAIINGVSGHVRVYQLIGNTWTRLGLDIDGEASGDQSGWSVSMNAAGDRVAIGAGGNDGNGLSGSGHVRVYQLIGNTWTQLGADLDGEAVGDWSGYSVSMNATGDRVAIGAIFNDGNGLNSGHVRIYQWNSSTDAWTKMGQDLDGEAANDQSGYSVSMNAAGDRVAIGAPIGNLVKVYQLPTWNTLVLNTPGGTSSVGGTDQANKLLKLNNDGFVDNSALSSNILRSSVQTLTEPSITQVHKNLKVRRHEVTTFTPVTTGWYRIIQHTSVIGCVLRITSNNETEGRTTDAEVSIHVDKDTRGVMNQTRHSARKGGHVSMLRVARNQDGFVVVDINISTEGTQITLEAEGLLFPGFVPTISRLATQAITDNETNLVDDLPLANGLRSTGQIASHLGSSRDPGTSLSIAGRAGYLHGLNLTAGSPRFTGASDHFHLFFNGASGAGSGSRTAQGGSAWNSFQMQNSNSTLTNEIFLGGVTSFFYGENEFATVDVDGVSIKYGISTDRVETTGSGDGSGYLGPVAPDFTAEVDFWFTSDTGLPDAGITIMANFPTGVAGISAAILPGIVLSKTLIATAPDGTTNKWRLRVKLYGLNAIEWNKSQATAFSPSVVWRLSTTPNAVAGNQSLAVHPTRRDKVIATFNSPHGLFVGQVMVLRLAAQTWGISAGSYSGCITKIISANSFEMKVGIVRQENPFEASAREYLSTYSGLPANTLRVPSHNFSDGEAVRVRAIGQLQTGLSENTTYYVKRHSSQPAHWIQLFNNQTLTNQVIFTSTNKFGIYTIYTEAHPAPLAADNWSIHRGNRDPVHQQTISDVGWRMNRNVFGDRRGLAAGTIAQVTLGGLCDIPYWITGSLAAGFNSSAEADFSYSLGKDLRNVTPESVEIGVDNSFKLRVTPNKASLITSGVESQLITSLPTGATIYVDSGAGVGTDTRTGFSKYDISKPFATIGAAMAASVIGDTVRVRAGSYTITSTISLNGKGYLHFEEGAVVTCSVSGPVFSLTANESKSISGGGQFFITGSTTTFWVQSGGGLQTQLCSVECATITNTNPPPPPPAVTIFDVSTGVLVINAETVYAPFSTIIYCAGTSSNLHYAVKFTYCSKFAHFPTSESQAQMSCDCWTIACYGTKCFQIVGGTVAAKYETLVDNAPNGCTFFSLEYGNDSTPNVLVIKGGRAITYSNNPCIRFTTTTGTSKVVRLIGDPFFHTAGDNSIFSEPSNPRTVLSSFASSNKPVGGGVSITGNYSVNAGFTS
jgi:hypothetical protein